MVTTKTKNTKTKTQTKAARSAAAKKAAATRRANAQKNNGTHGTQNWNHPAQWAAQDRWQGSNAWKRQNQGLQLCAYADVGFGNQLFIRGEGCGLSWEQGIPMQCEGSNCWCWQPEAWAQSQDAAEGVQFKVLVNDEVWCEGPNCCVNAQCKLEWTPSFKEWNESQNNQAW